MSQIEEYLEKINTIPLDVNRQLRLIKELDLRQLIATQKLEELQDEFLIQFRQTKDKKKLEDKKKNIEGLQNEILGYAKEKVNITEQMQSQIDFSIIELDREIKKIEDSQKVQQTSVIQNDFVEAAQPYINKKKKKLENKQQEKNKIQQNTNLQFNNDPSAIWTYEQDEQKYCYCEKPQFGEMIGCENEKCERGWFHYECIGITVAPEGSWYCKDCIKKLKKQ